jgi:Chitobiase/beta-hexosaminidase C-terminal domain
MKKMMVLLSLFFIKQAGAQQQFQLAPPLLTYESAFFKNKMGLKILFNEPGTTIRYTLNGSEPTEKDRQYKTPLTITENTIVKAKVFGKNFIPSAMAKGVFIKDGKAIQQIIFSAPDKDFTSAKKDILYDNIGGDLNFRNGNWLGYNTDTVEINIELRKNQTIASLCLNVLQDQNSWIFLPKQLLLYYYDAKQNQFLPAGSIETAMQHPSPKQCILQKISVSKKVITNKLKLIILPLKKIPDWASGKGTHAWLFIDEIKVY